MHFTSGQFYPVPIIQEWIHLVQIYNAYSTITQKTQWVSNIFVEVTLILLQILSQLLTLCSPEYNKSRDAKGIMSQGPD